MPVTPEMMELPSVSVEATVSASSSATVSRSKGGATGEGEADAAAAAAAEEATNAVANSAADLALATSAADVPASTTATLPISRPEKRLSGMSPISSCESAVGSLRIWAHSSRSDSRSDPPSLAVVSSASLAAAAALRREAADPLLLPPARAWLRRSANRRSLAWNLRPMIACWFAFPASSRNARTLLGSCVHWCPCGAGDSS